ncbi:MAG TPA: TraG family conjugative transposon ATPase, partial [Tenuifilaceae bacterium]|nr:TraG family conjugative transposon ATPase [Tenuifilaceae bacterium]
VQNDAELFTLVSVIIIEMVLQKIKRLKGVKKSLIIDEALNFLEDPKMGSFIGYLYRTIRKKEGEVYIAAQNVKFLDGIAPMVRDSIIINTDTKILLDHSKHKSSYADLRRILSLNESQIGLLDSLVGGNGFREFLIILGRKNGIFRMEVSEFADSIYTSKEKDVREIERIFEQVGSLPAAVEQYIHNKKMAYEN